MNTNPYKKKFTSIQLVENLLKTYNWLNEELRKMLKPFGVTLQQYNVLKILKGAGQPLTTSVIRERMIEPMCDASRMVERLNLKGWVTRKTSTIDKRLVDITISQQGLKFLENFKDFENKVDQLYKGISIEEAKFLNRVLNKLRRASLS